MRLFLMSRAEGKGLTSASRASFPSCSVLLITTSSSITLGIRVKKLKSEMGRRLG